jgi:hypothetical protein
MTPRLEAALTRLQDALARIESVLGQRLPAADAERLRELTDQLSASRAENQELAAANVSVAARLDSAIDRLRAVLRS